MDGKGGGGVGADGVVLPPCANVEAIAGYCRGLVLPQNVGQRHFKFCSAEDSTCGFFKTPWSGYPAFVTWGIDDPAGWNTHGEIVFETIDGFAEGVFRRRISMHRSGGVVMIFWPVALAARMQTSGTR